MIDPDPETAPRLDFQKHVMCNCIVLGKYCPIVVFRKDIGWKF